MELALDIQHVVKRFAQHVAVRELSLQVPQGTVYGLLGPNGAGKTTTIRMILNIIMPDQGSIRVLGRPNTESKLLDRVGYLPEERGLYKRMQVRRLLRFLAELKGIGAREADRRIGPWLERLTLKTADKDWGNSKVDELSRGMQQKVQFIGCLLHEPDVIILDEPFSGLDPINAQSLKDIIVELRRRGKTILFSTHVMESAERLCDAVCIIARGEKVLDDSLARVKGQYGVRHVALAVGDHATDGVRTLFDDPRLVKSVDDQNRFFEIELAEGANPQDLLQRVVALGVPLERFELVQPSLHQIFLERVGAKGIDLGVTGHG